MRKIIILLCLLLSITAAYSYPQSVQAYTSPLTADEQHVLEQSLSIHEIDREIARIESQQNETERSISELSEQLEVKNEQIKDIREQAGARIRAYYMGEREDLLAALLSVGSLRDFISVLDYYELIMDRDRTVLSSYKTEYADLKKTKIKLESVSAELTQIKTNLQLQRTRVAALQEQVDTTLGHSADPEKLMSMIEELTKYWENIGLYEVRRYFRALSTAMSDFSDFLDDHKDSLVSEKGGYRLEVREEDLNAFLRDKNERLQDVSFEFEQGKIIVHGSREGLRLEVEGHYTVENEPENSITFHVDRLFINGFELPDTTRKELEQDFDLGFYPKKIVPFVEATEVDITQGTLTVKLKLSF